MIELSIVVPCYNEGKNIPLVLKRFEETLKKAKLQKKVELILVNNNSKDDSAAVLKKELKKHAFARTIVQKKPGYGAAVAKGLRAGKGTYLCWTHADMQTDPNDTVKAYKLIRKQKNPEMCYAKGNRKGRPFISQFFTAGMSVFETVYMGTLLYDINAQPNVFHRDLLKNMKWLPDDFSLDLFMLYSAKKRGLKVIRFPVQFPKRLHGESSWDTGLGSVLKFSMRTFKFSRKLKREIR